MREETGFEVRCTKLAAVLDRDLHYNEAQSPFHIYKLMFLCEIVGEADALCHDILETAFFPVGGSSPALPAPHIAGAHRTDA